MMRRHLSWMAALVTVIVLVGACNSAGGSSAPSGSAAASGGASAQCAGTGTQGGSADLQIPDVEAGTVHEEGRRVDVAADAPARTIDPYADAVAAVLTSAGASRGRRATAAAAAAAAGRGRAAFATGRRL